MPTRPDISSRGGPAVAVVGCVIARSVLLVTVSLLSASLARAEDEAIAVHDGFYLRLSTGFGGYREGIARSGERTSTTVSGIATSDELAVGGTPWPGLVVGAGLWSTSVLASRTHTRADEPEPDVARGDASFTLIGPFFDYYFDPRRGLHLQAAVGIASVRGVRLDTAELDSDRSAVGVGVVVGLGYDWWVSRQWSLGAIARLAVVSASGRDRSDTRWNHAIGSTPAVLFTAVYH